MRVADSPPPPSLLGWQRQGGDANVHDESSGLSPDVGSVSGAEGSRERGASSIGSARLHPRTGPSPGCKSCLPDQRHKEEQTGY